MNTSSSTIVEVLQWRAKHQPNKIGYVFLNDGEIESASLTYKELDYRAKLVSTLLRRSAQAGDRALLIYPPGLDFIIAFLGCLYAGVVAVPVDMPRRNQRTQRLQKIVSDARANLILTVTEVLPTLENSFPSDSGTQLLGTDGIEADGAALFEPSKISADTLAFLQYTSGSTGNPKGVMVSHGNLMHNEKTIKKAFNHSENTIFVGWLPLFHDMGLIGNVLQPMYLGIPSYLMSPVAFLQKPIRWLRAIDKYKATTSGGPNFAYDLCVNKITPEQRAELDLSSWNLAFNGAEPVRAETLTKFANIFSECGFNPAAVYPCYGMAETTLFTTGNWQEIPSIARQVDSVALSDRKIIIPSNLPADDPTLTSIVSCGRAWLDTEIEIVDPGLLTRCAPDRVGEIWVASESVAQGYWNRPDDTEQIFKAQIANDEREQKFLRTGDLGFVHDGELFVTGRLKDVIIIRGRNHYPQDIELTVANCQPSLAMNSGAAFMVEIGGEEKLVIAQEVERTQRRQIDREAIETAVLAAVSEQHELQVDALLLLKPGTIPKTSSGKIQRSACRQAFLDRTFDLIVEPSELFTSTINPDRSVDFDKSSQLESVDNSARSKLKNDRDRQIKTPSPVANPVLMTLVINAIRKQVALTLDKPIDRIFATRNFHSFGTDSLKAVEIIGNLSQYLELQLSPTLLFEHSTPAELAAHLVQTYCEHLSAKFLTPPPDVDAPTTSDPDDRSQPATVNASGDIAVIGMSCRFPQAPDLESYWQLLANGDNAITEVPTQRWAQNWYDVNLDTANKTYSRWGGFIDNVDLFDPLFFQISPREAELMDPQQRIFLEVVWEALEHAGYRPEQLEPDRVGVFVGCSNNGYYRRIEGQLQAADYSAGIGNQNPIIANRVSFLLNLRGPSVLVDTLCSSSLVSLHMACQSIRQGECNAAIAGGVNLQLSPEYYVGMSRMKVHSPTGQCYAFDDRANGIVLGEGAGAVLLKPLERAIADGDRIHGIIKGSAVNNDGRTNGLTAPNPASQADVIRTALDNAGVSAETISYVEAHGTGTTLGDPIEIEGLTKAFRVDTDQKQFCAIGSVKTNLGHLESAAGIAQFIKVLLSLQHQQLPPSLNFDRPNPYIPFDTSPFVVNNQLQAWESASTPRRAGVSSFGMGGTNAHVVVEEAPTLKEIHNQVDRTHHLLMLSAKSEQALNELVDRYHQLLTNRPGLSLADLCFTANTGRVQFNERLGIVTDSISDLTAQLTAYRQQQLTPNIYRGSSQKKSTAKIAYLFTGQGSLSVRMGRQLYETQPTFRQAIAECAVLMEPHLDQPLLSILYPTNGQKELIDRTIYAQPALFALEYALFKLWQSWGITPDAVLGHSLGEYVAAVVAGVMSLADGIKLVTTRARLMQNLPTVGEMVAVFATPADIQKTIEIDGRQLTFAVYNSPENTVIAGDKQAISHACAALAAEGIGFKPLDTTNAFHSPLMEPMLPKFQQLAATISYTSPQIPLISNLTGAQVDKIDAEYWCQHLQQSVRFVDGIQALAELDINIFVEIGPKPTLLAIGQQCLPVDDDRLWLSSLRGIADGTQMLHSLVRLAVNGVAINWVGFDRDYARQRVPLPTYPFQRKSYWIDPPMDTEPFAPIPSNQNLSFASQDSALASVDMTDRQRQQDILNQLHTSVAKLLKADLAEVDINAPFLEMGADSLVLVEAIGYVERTFGLKVGIRQIFEELTTIALLAKYIHEQIPLEITSPEPVLATSTNGKSATNGNSGHHHESNKLSSTSNVIQSTGAVTMNSASGLERIMQQQLQVVSNTMSDIVAQQLSFLREQTGNFEPAPNAITGIDPKKYQPVVSTVNEDRKSPPLPPIAEKSPLQSTSQLSPSIELDRFINSYTQKTFGSKNATQISRDVLADSRASAGFRPSLKELVYPIIGDRAAGAYCWDIDGNKYIDITMGFGVLLFGHNPQFVKDAISNQLERGLQIGPQAPLAGEVARSIAELTGTERVAFCNSGTEAVMTAIRLARHTTGRNKIVIFTNSYHGHFDGILATASQGQSIPSTTGIAPLTVSDVLVLEYGEDSALEVVRANATEIAAVIVEPVQSRNLSLQPREFLQQLRLATAASGIALVFDEVLLGFRIHQGGAQAWFDIKADLVTYGKIIGGGLPIGVVAGRAEYLDGIDGGSWSYGNASYPSTEKTFFAGTFNKNHLGMAAAHAVVQHLTAAGPSLQAELNQRTQILVSTLNDFFVSEEVPIRVLNFGSLFRFTFSGNFDQFFYHLIAKGIYIWEGRACFLSTAHTDEDVNQIVRAIQSTVREIRADGFWPRSSSDSATLPSSQKQATTVSSMATAKVEPADAPVGIPLTKAQQQLWFLAQLGDNSSAAYNESVIIQLRGELKLAAMQQALQKIVDRHEALRTKIDPTGEVQHICLSVKIDVPVIDFSDINDNDRESQVTAWLQEDRQTPFDFTKNSLFRCQILKLEAQQHLLVVSAHHIIIDGWSMGIMLQEIAAIYSAECENISSELTSPLQFRSYVQWLEQQADTAAMASHQSYWLEQLYDPIPVLELPTDRPRRATKTFRANRQTIELETKLSNDLRRVSREQGCTLFMTMLSAYKTLFHRLTGQDDILIGISTAGRSLEGSQELIGYCTHLLPIRSQFVDNPSFLEYLLTLRGVLLAAYEHQDYPFANLLELLSEQRKTNHVPLITATFNLERSLAVPEMSGLDTSLYSGAIGFADYDLNLNVIEVGTELVLSCDYSTDLFDGATISRLLGHFQTVLLAVVENPQQAVSELPLLSESERQQLLFDWNDTQTDYPQDKCIHQLFEEQVAKTPNAIAVVFEQQELTYQQLNQRANQLAHHLQTLGVKPEVLVGICVERSLEMVVGLLGILKAGGAYVPLDPSYPTERLSYLLSDAGIEVLLIQDNLLSVLPSHTARVVRLDIDLAVIEQYSQANLVTGAADDLAYIIYTSGSTGQPKGVLVAHQNLVNAYFAWEEAYQLQTHARNHLQMASLSFDVFGGNLVRALCSGGKLVICPLDYLLNAEKLYELMVQQEIDCAEFVPAVARNLMEYLEETHQDLSFMKVTIVGSDNWYIEEHERIRKLCHEKTHLINSYGVTEATVDSCYFDNNYGREWVEKLVPIGKPFANTQVYILDSQLQPVPIGVAGELHIGGDGLARGYLNRPELTQAKFVLNPFSPDRSPRLYKTGDLARYLPDGNIEFLGRIDHQVKIRGFRIELGEIEAVLSNHLQVRQAVAIVTADSAGNNRLIAYVVSEEETLSTQQLREFLQQQLPAYMVPSAFVILNTLPLTPNGKVDRKALPAPDGEIEREQEYVAPQTPNQEIVAHIFTSVLGVEKVGIHDNFFELGGHSLLATQLTSRLKHSFAVDIPLRAVFEAPTVDRLARTIDRLRTQEQGWSLPVITRIVPTSESIPLSFAQERLWFLNQLEGASATYNMPEALRLTGDLNLDAFQQALTEIVRRHEVLRTSFTTVNGTPMQVIHPSASMDIAVTDLQHLTDTEREVVLEQH
ncbi:hybrid non-ribosomal peptide synthetase/type I polyketide synthase, partial [Chamaesiphon polymorphus]